MEGEDDEEEGLESIQVGERRYLTSITDVLERQLRDAQLNIRNLEARLAEYERQLADPAALRQLLRRAEKREGGGASVESPRASRTPSYSPKSQKNSPVPLEGHAALEATRALENELEEETMSPSVLRVTFQDSKPSSSENALQKSGTVSSGVMVNGRIGEAAPGATYSPPHSPSQGNSVAGGSPSSEETSKKHLSVWSAFFENASKAKLSGGGAGALGVQRGGDELSTLALFQAISVGSLPSIDNLLILGASCTTLFSSSSQLLPYPHLKSVDGNAEKAAEFVTLDSMLGFSLTALHVAAAAGRLDVLEILGDAALMEREESSGKTFGAKEEFDDALWPSTPRAPSVGALDVRDEQGASPLMIAASLALFHWSCGGDGEAYSKCVLHILGSAADASLSTSTLSGITLGHITRGLEQLDNSSSKRLAAALYEYSELTWTNSPQVK